MNTTTKSTWYQANIQYLFNSIGRIRQLLTNYIESQENPTTQLNTPAEPQFPASPPSALEQLCTTFGLSEGDRDILLLCVGVEIDSNIGRLCGTAQGNPELNYPTLGLALAALPTASWNILSAQNPLQRWELIEIAEIQTLTQSPIKIDKHILCYLLGEPTIDSQLKGILKPIPPLPLIPLPPSHQKLADQIVVNWSKVPANTIYPALQLCGAEASAKYAIALDAMQTLGWNLQRISAQFLPTNPDELDRIIQRSLRSSILTNTALLLDCDEINPSDGIREAAICQFIEGFNMPLLLSTKQRIPARQRPQITLDVGKLSHSEQLALWQECLGEFSGKLSDFIDELVVQFNLSTSAIYTASWQIKNQFIDEITNIDNLEENIEKEDNIPLSQIPEVENPPSPALESKEVPPKRETRKTKTTTPSNTPEITPSPSIKLISKPQSPLQSQLWNICRNMARERLNDLAQRIEPTATWEDLILPDKEKNMLLEIAAQVRQRVKVYQEWGLAGKSQRGLGISAMFYGSSGTGKTLAADVLAGEFNLDLYKIDLSAVVSKYIGETEKNLSRIFDAAEAGGGILLFDEADALFGKRTEVKDSHDRHANVEVNYLLQRMEEYQGLAILTTNMKNALDGAFYRRIRFIVPFTFPDSQFRSKIWRRVFPKATPTEGLDFSRLGKLNMAGGNIRNIAMNAAFLAADAGEPVMMKHLLQATKTECVKVERLLTDVEVKGWV